VTPVHMAANAEVRHLKGCIPESVLAEGAVFKISPPSVPLPRFGDSISSNAGSREQMTPIAATTDAGGFHAAWQSPRRTRD